MQTSILIPIARRDIVTGANDYPRERRTRLMSVPLTGYSVLPDEIGIGFCSLLDRRVAAI